MDAFTMFASALPLAALYAFGFATRLIDRRYPSLSALMNEQRFNWVTQAARRDTPLDAILAGNIMSSVSFFASTTALLVLALFTVIGSLHEFLPALTAITFGPSYSELDLQVHNVILLILFVYAFLAFTMSLRQFNQFCILIGGLDQSRPVNAEEIRTIASINAMAARRFNAGIQSYYFAIPMLAWFVSSWAAIAVTLGTIALLLYREYFSSARWLVARITPH